MSRFLSTLLLSLSVIPISHGAPLQDVEVIIRPKDKPRSVRPVAPKGSRVARTRTNGVLFVLTDPFESSVVVKDSRGQVRAKEAIVNGEFRQEFPAGTYEIEVSSPGHVTWTTAKPVVLRASAWEIERADLRPTTGSIVIGPVEQGVSVLINGKKPASLGANLEKRPDQIEIENIPEGFYSLRIEQPNFAPISKDKVEVRGGSTSLVTIRLEAATAEMTVTSEPGASVYIDNEFVGETTGDGKLRRGNVKIGRREVKLVKEGFEEFKANYQFEMGKPVILERSLVPKATSAEFSDDFGINLRKWAAPASGWVRKAGRLEISNASAVGYANGYNYRNFVMQFHLKLENGGGAAWAVRVKDSKNYYLFYLSGPQGLFSKRFNVYFVENNKVDLQNPVSSVPVIQDLRAGGQYTVEISVVGNKIEHKITPLSTGVAEPLGFFEDPANLFPIGSIGFRTVAGEVFSIDDLFVQPR